MSTGIDALTSAVKTKIVATIGPATESPERIRELIQAGATTFRLNFSHGDHSEHAERIATIRQVAHELGAHIGILQDLQGQHVTQDCLEINQFRFSYFHISSIFGFFHTLSVRPFSSMKSVIKSSSNITFLLETKSSASYTSFLLLPTDLRIRNLSFIQLYTMSPLLNFGIIDNTPVIKKPTSCGQL